MIKLFMRILNIALSLVELSIAIGVCAHIFLQCKVVWVGYISSKSQSNFLERLDTNEGKYVKDKKIKGFDER